MFQHCAVKITLKCTHENGLAVRFVERCQVTLYHLMFHQDDSLVIFIGLIHHSENQAFNLFGGPISSPCSVKKIFIDRKKIQNIHTK